MGGREEGEKSGGRREMRKEGKGGGVERSEREVERREDYD